MDRYKKLLGNSAIFAIGTLGSKLISFILVPFYTFVLTKSQFGIVDLITTTVNMILPIVTLSAFDSVFRFVLDKNGTEDAVFVNGLVISCLGSLIGTIIIPILLFFGVPMPGYIYLLLVSGAFLSLMLNFARAIGMVKIFAIAGILGTVIIAFSNVIFLLILDMGIKGYLSSIILSNFSVLLFLIVFTKAWTRIRVTNLSKSLMISMIKYSLPLIPNAFAWWINSSADRYFILAFVGASANGIYAVASKIPTLLNIVSQIFFQSWQMSAVEEFNSEDASVFYSKTFNYFAAFQFIGVAGLILILKPLMKFMVSPSYYIAWVYIPFLLLAVMYSSLSGFLGTTYTAAKRTAGIFLTTIIGAASNIVFGILFVPWLGLQGASFAGFLSFAIVLITRLIDTKKFMPIKPNKKQFIVNHAVILSMILVLFIDSDLVYEFVLELSMFIVLIFFNRSLFIEMFLWSRK